MSAGSDRERKRAAASKSARHMWRPRARVCAVYKGLKRKEKREKNDTAGSVVGNEKEMPYSNVKGGGDVMGFPELGSRD